MNKSPTYSRILLLTFLLLISSGALQTVFAQQNEPGKDSRRDSTLMIDEITVAAYRVSEKLRRIPGSISVITADDIRLADATQQVTILNSLPGISMQSGTPATGRIVIRGIGSRTPYNTNRIKAWLNGLPLTGSDGISAVEDMDFQNLGRIEVVKGPSSALYGAGLGGSISLHTPRYSRDTLKFSTRYGAFHTGNLNFSGNLNRENGDWWSSVNHFQTSGYRENSRYRRTSLLTTGYRERGKWSANATLMLNALRGEIPSSLNKTMFDQNPQAAAPNWKAINGYQQTTSVLAGTTLTNRLSDKTTAHFTLFTKWNNDYERRPFNNLDDQSLTIGFTNRLTIHGTKTDWVGGIEYLTDKYSWELDKDITVLNKNHENRSHFQIWGTGYLKPSAGLVLSIAGALNHTLYRLTDQYPDNGDQSGRRNFPVMFSPRAGISYAPGDRVVYFASAGHGYSLPSPEETLLPEGDVNPGIKPESGWQAEAGVRMHLFNNKLFLDMTLYHIGLRNLLVTKRISEDIFTGINAGKTRHQGIEWTMRNPFFSLNRFPGSLKSFLSYTQSTNTFLDFSDGGNRFDGNKLPGIPDRSIQYQLIWNPFSAVEMVMHLGYTGNQYLNDGNSLKQPGYFLGNLKLSARFNVAGKISFDLFLGINNLTDTRYASMVVVNAISTGGSLPRYYYPGLPRHGYVGMEIRF